MAIVAQLTLVRQVWAKVGAAAVRPRHLRRKPLAGRGPPRRRSLSPSTSIGLRAEVDEDTTSTWQKPRLTPSSASFLSRRQAETTQEPPPQRVEVSPGAASTEVNPAPPPSQVGGEPKLTPAPPTSPSD
eukprot:CAMPEP_0172548036 /NCGR_PEP_ID=MMETSP1067-20121228/17442_1 /TAXON_ID=265564 ORGANISM="Thalassiosira punctigera, Strain Tpunct2005C2" /NCGR_SAMPLE_ID=MMETSP1067 /ASSEMBLY_ACC=CAM_ASM_000444 /LENGTH=128 /DNA_ID=CAMNT_0013335217 /DNA_START=147 /DNA_END=533 /DNA_ORIENTATION=-